MIDTTIQEYRKPLPRMRVAAECYQMIHEEDPESRVSLTYIRRLAKTGAVPVHWAGNRCLINYDALVDYLNSPAPERVPAQGYGQIRRVPER